MTTGRGVHGRRGPRQGPDVSPPARAGGSCCVAAGAGRRSRGPPDCLCPGGRGQAQRDRRHAPATPKSEY
ncbi:hypothetical protein AZ78_4072 [Lysobacter capsici AZ78]|uniref:Uncharacterized protein n=1 Tax=Lysobacter capsici AZ78 TaxID=1444315 RepID=A0A120AHP6_9GAMM|nr:hypothetical protein AZ78_4072 [Lysobacter capsici AZ78]